MRLVDGCGVGWPIFVSVWQSREYVIGGLGVGWFGAAVTAEAIFVFSSPEQRARVDMKGLR